MSTDEPTLMFRPKRRNEPVPDPADDFGNDDKPAPTAPTPRWQAQIWDRIERGPASGWWSRTTFGTKAMIAAVLIVVALDVALWFGST